MQILTALALFILAAPVLAGSADTALAEAMKADRAFDCEAARLGLEGWLSYLAADATIFPPGQDPIQGLAAIRAHYQRSGFSPAGLRWQPRGGECSADGGFCVTWGTWQRTSPGQAQPSHTGSYLSVWRRQGDGSWKVLADIGNPDPTPRPNLMP